VLGKTFSFPRKYYSFPGKTFSVWKGKDIGYREGNGGSDFPFTPKRKKKKSDFNKKKGTEQSMSMAAV